MRTTETNLKERYDLLLKSGMFWELLPECTGIFKEDKEVFEKFIIQRRHVQLQDRSFEANPANPEAHLLKKTKKVTEYYYKKFDGKKVDVYRVLKIFGITEPAQQHAIKKLLRAGKSIKSVERDIDEVIESLERWKEMIVEETE